MTGALAAGAILVAFNCCILGPHQIYAPNQAEFESTYREVLPLLAGAGLLVAVLLALIGFLIPQRRRLTYATLLLGVGLLLWIQGSFLKWDYGDFNGVNIDWSQYAWHGWLDAGVWLAALALLVRFRVHIRPYAHVLVLAFVLLQTGLLLLRGNGGAARRPGDPSKPAATAAPSEVPAETCRISKTLNVFHIILDAFQTDVFMELVHEEGLADKLDGFVLYRDNAAPASQTTLCVPAILTGSHYEGGVLPSEYYRAAMSESFHNQLATRGYVVNLMPYMEMPGARFTSLYQSPRSYAWPQRTRMLQTASFMIDVGMFRQTPHFLKRVIYNSRNWRLSSLVTTPPNHVSFHQKRFFRDYIEKLAAVHDAPAYHFVHLSPPHPPYVTTAEGHYAGEALPDTRDNFKNEARYVLRIFMDLLEKLRQLDAYDGSIILLQGDHGSNFTPVFDGEEFPMPVNRLPALLTLKTVDAHGPLRTSDAPTTAADVPATIMDLLRYEHSYAGESIARMTDGAPRQRTYAMLDEEAGGGRVLRRWTIDGSIYDPSSFHESDAREVRAQIRDYAWGTPLGFGVTGSGEAYLTSGWWPTVAMHWSNGHESQMRFRITPPTEDVVLEFKFFFHVVPGEVEQQRVRMRVNGNAIGGEQVSRDPEPKGIRYLVPRRLLQSDLMTIDFEFPDAAFLRENRKVPIQRAVGLWGFRADLASAMRGAPSMPVSR
ncbi:MAG: sulfatase-like hydrolase/transferase [Candidatus Latescibacterota bacterium]|nr:MAG: sulfatase-like hydrolase/transferase [Candidatus Latescibacterota bacterium]